jgi:hypothetical protein
MKLNKSKTGNVETPVRALDARASVETESGNVTAATGAGNSRAYIQRGLEVKFRAAQLMATGDYYDYQIAQEVGISTRTLRHWKQHDQAFRAMTEDAIPVDDETGEKICPPPLQRKRTKMEKAAEAALIAAFRSPDKGAVKRVMEQIDPAIMTRILMKMR